MLKGMGRSPCTGIRCDKQVVLYKHFDVKISKKLIHKIVQICKLQLHIFMFILHGCIGLIKISNLNILPENVFSSCGFITKSIAPFGVHPFLIPAHSHRCIPDWGTENVQIELTYIMTGCSKNHFMFHRSVPHLFRRISRMSCKVAKARYVARKMLI